MTTTFLSALLLAGIAWAVPLSPPDSPARHASKDKVMQTLSHAGAGYCRSGDLTVA